MQEGCQCRKGARRAGKTARPAAQHQHIGIQGAEMRAQKEGAAMARQLRFELVEHGVEGGLGLALDLGGACLVARIDVALRVEVQHHRCLQGIAQPEHPFVKLRTLGRAQWRRQAGLRMGVTEMQQDRRRLVQHEVTVHQHRDRAAGVELQIGWAFMRVGCAIHQGQLERRADFAQQHMRRHAGVAGEVVQGCHDRGSRFQARSVSAKARRDQSAVRLAT